MKVIDLYKNIANNEELPKKIKLKDYGYIFTLREDCSGYKWYGEEKMHDDFGEVIHKNLEFVLKQEIEIIEEDKPIEELKSYVIGTNNWIEAVTDLNHEVHKQNLKINEIIKVVIKLKKESDK